MTAPAFAVVGMIRNAQGIRGEVVVEPLTDTPDIVFAPGRRVLVGDRSGNTPLQARGLPSSLTVDSTKPFKGGLIVKFDDVADRNAAELLRGRYLLAPFEELEPPAPGEIYLHDLIGMRVRAGQRTGRRRSDVVLRAAAGTYTRCGDVDWKRSRALSSRNDRAH